MITGEPESGCRRGDAGTVPVDHFGEDVAARYDAELGERGDPAAVERTVAFLAELAGDSGALEFGIGTGRVALPLSARGVAVHGIDLSAAMLARLRAKPGGERVTVTQGDFASTRVDGRFGLVYLVFNTLANLTTQAAQVACFANAAAHLRPGGRFVVELEVPQLQRLPLGERFVPFAVTPTHLGFDEYDVVAQGLVSHHYAIDGGRGRVRSIPFRYAWPAELDLMAQLAGLRPVHRWADFDRSEFTATSTSHVSAWEKPAG